MNEADPRLAQDILSLIDKLLVGAIAIVSSVLTQWVNHKWTREHDKEKLLQDKVEKLVAEIQSLDDWVGYAQNRALSDCDSTSERRDSIGHVITLFELYFPSLEKEYKALMKSMDVTLSALSDQQVLHDRDKWATLFQEHLKVSRRCVSAISQQVKGIHG